MLYKILNQKHAEYDPDLLLKKSLLMAGGSTIAKNAGIFIDQKPGETDEAYTYRLSYASYHPYFNEIINNFRNAVFSKELIVVPAADASDTTTPGDKPKQSGFYEEFSRDTDNKGSTLAQTLADRLEEILAYSFCYVGLDFPQSDQVVTLLSEENALKLNRAYTYVIDPACVINWQCDDKGNFLWLTLKYEQVNTGRNVEANTYTVFFKQWFMDGETVKYEVYSKTYDIKHMPQKDDDFPKVEEGSVSFKQIPIVKSCVSDGLNVGELLYPMQVEHYRLHSSLLMAEERSLFPIHFFGQSNDLDQIGNIQSENVNRGNVNRMRQQMQNRGIIVGTDKDKFEIKEVEGKSFSICQDQIHSLEDSMHNISHQMAKSLRRLDTEKSGISKMLDNQSEELVLSSLADVVKDLAKRIFTLISEARNEDIEWSVIGLEGYRVVNADSALQEAIQIPLVNIPSKTFNKHRLNRIASGLEPSMNPVTAMTVKAEIEQAVDALPDEAFAAQNHNEPDEDDEEDEK